MEAIIAVSGSQRQVSKGIKVSINRVDAEVGSDLNFDVLAVLGEQAEFGAPTVKGAKVTAKVLRHFRDDKITVFKYKRRKGYHKKQGHRQDLTEVEITDISKV